MSAVPGASAEAPPAEPRSKPAPRAQLDDAPPGPSASAVAKPSASQEVIWDRPPEGLRRGRWAAPRWAVLGLGIAVAVLVLLYFVARVRRIRADSGGA